MIYTPELIQKKRDGFELTEEECRYIIEEFVRGSIPDYQMTAFLMAVYFRSMTERECVEFTMAMANSGDLVDLSAINGFKVDKHSTGGVGDKTSIVLAPLVAAAGGIVAKMTGRELSHTGGTVDKLESIPGMRLDLTEQEFIDNVNRIGVSLLAQTADLAPADKMIYALRNVTATVDSIPLMAASIMSKKIAAGANGIVLDVKTGSGAFMKEYEGALELAQTMVAIGEGAGRKTIAFITSMEQPLGRAIGNSVEVKEAIDTLSGRGPDDLVNLVTSLGGAMLVLSGKADSPQEGKEKLAECIENKAGLNKLRQLIETQDGDGDVIEHPEKLPQASQLHDVVAEKTGYIQKINAFEAGMASKVLGAGRKTKEDKLDLSIGIVLNKKIGDRVEKGESLAVLHSDGDKTKLEPAELRLKEAIIIGDEKTALPPLFYAMVSKDKVEEF